MPPLVFVQGIPLLVYTVLMSFILFSLFYRFKILIYLLASFNVASVTIEKSYDFPHTSKVIVNDLCEICR